MLTAPASINGHTVDLALLPDHLQEAYRLLREARRSSYITQSQLSLSGSPESSLTAIQQTIATLALAATQLNQVILAEIA